MSCGLNPPSPRLPSSPGYDATGRRDSLLYAARRRVRRKSAVGIPAYDEMEMRTGGPEMAGAPRDLGQSPSTGQSIPTSEEQSAREPTSRGRFRRRQDYGGRDEGQATRRGYTKRRQTGGTPVLRRRPKAAGETPVQLEGEKTR